MSSVARRTFSLALALVLASCTPPTSAEGDVTLVTAYQVSPAFNNFREVCTVRYTLAAPALVSIRVTVEQEGERRLVTTLATEQREPRGGRSAAWRGVGADGFFAPQGTYQVELTARRSGASSDPVSWTLPTFLYRD